MIFAALLALVLQTDPPETKEDCKKALDAFHAAYRTGGEPGRIAAIEGLAKHKCPNAIAALAPLLGSESEKVRIAAAKALGGMDHPKALEALTDAVTANEGVKDVFTAVLKALQAIDWEAGAEPLNALLTKYHDKGLIDEVHEVIPVLGSLGSPSSVEPLLSLLEHAENQGKAQGTGRYRTAGTPKLVALEGPIKAALQQITGGNEPNYPKWRQYWHANRDTLLAQAVLVYRCKLTGKRFEQKGTEAQVCPYHDKSEKDGVVVKTRLHSRA
jgi:hypothetical protein